VERFCDEALWLDHGRAQAHGDPKRVVDAYLTAVEQGEEEMLAVTTARAVAAAATATPDSVPPPAATSGESAAAIDAPGGPAEESGGASDENGIQDMFRAAEGRWGSREVEIVHVDLLDHDGRPSFVYPSGDALTVRMKVRAQAPVDDFVFGISLFNADGVCCYGTNTFIEEMTPQRLAGDAEISFDMATLDLVEGTYKLDVAVHKRDGYPYDYHRLLYTFRVKSRVHDVGIYRPAHRWSFSGDVSFAAKD
jgi:hypothetical protein